MYTTSFLSIVADLRMTWMVVMSAALAETGLIWCWVVHNDAHGQRWWIRMEDDGVVLVFLGSKKEKKLRCG